MAGTGSVGGFGGAGGAPATVAATMLPTDLIVMLDRVPQFFECLGVHVECRLFVGESRFNLRAALSERFWGRLYRKRFDDVVASFRVDVARLACRKYLFICLRALRFIGELLAGQVP